MRTAPVDELTQAEIIVDTGAAMAAVPARSETARTPRHLRDDIETSGESCQVLGYKRPVYRDL
jgi:hypothetical protein